MIARQRIVEELDRVEPDRLRYLDELDEIQSSLAVLVLGDERLRSVQADRDIGLSEFGLRAASASAAT